MNQCRGKDFKESRVGNNYVLSAHVPVSESIGLNERLRHQTRGDAIAQCDFDHWQIMSDDPFVLTRNSAILMNEIRVRKGLGRYEGNFGKELEKYLDRL